MAEDFLLTRQYRFLKQVAHLIKNLPVIQETLVQFLG